MNTKFTLKNFRCFDSKGVTVDLKPITLLTGCNNSGKSSIVKALLLLSDYFEEINETKKKGQTGIDLFACKLDFTHKPHNLLGNFSKVVNRKSKSDDRSITMELQYPIEIFQGKRKMDVILEAKFVEAPLSFLKNGVLDNITIKEKNTDDITLYSNGKVLFNNWLLKFFETYPKEFYDYILGYKEKILYYFPILDSKLGGTHDECLNFLTTVSNEELLSKTKIRTELLKIIADFKEYEGGDFISWYRRKEREYFSLLSNKEFAVGKILEEARLKATDRFYEIDENSEDICADNLNKVFRKTRFHKKNSTTSDKHEDTNEFRMIFEAIEFLSYMYDEDNIEYQRFYSYANPEIREANESECFTCGVEFTFLTMVESLLEKSVCPNFEIQYVSSSVTNVRRLYPLDENDDFTQLLKNYIQKKDEYEKFISQKTEEERKEIFNPGDFIKKWIGEDGYKIGYDISIKGDEEGLGALIRLHQDENDKGSLLADSGYGITQLFAILLNIEVAIMETKMNSNLERTIAIEEPEIHLHPSYQSKLADMFYEAYNDYGIHFIVETHSEYLIRKTQVMVAEKNYETKEELEEKCPFTTYYVPDQSTGELPYALGYRRDGLFKKSFGNGFYDEAYNLLTKIL